MDSDNDSSNNKEEVPTPTVAPPLRLKAVSSKVGRTNYSRDELLHLFGVMERILPIGPEEWEQVVQEHSAVYSGRDVDSIRRKYTSLHRKQVPTGSPHMTPEIHAAKRIKYKIGDKADVGGGDDENFDLEKGFSGSSANEAPVDTVVGGVAIGTPAKRASSPAMSSVSNIEPRVQRKPKSKDVGQDFLELMKFQMMMEREDRLEQRKEMREQRIQQMKEDRERRNEFTGWVTALVGGISSAFGMEPPVKRPRPSGKEVTIDLESSSAETEE